VVDASQNPIESEINFDGRSLATVSAAGLFYNFSDHLGNLRARANTASPPSLVGADSDWPFGEFASYQNTVGSEHLTGEYFDSETGLSYFGARYYSPRLGRFMSPDWSEAPEPVPYADLSDPQTLNLYSYVANNPATASDPDGHREDLYFEGGGYIGFDTDGAYQAWWDVYNKSDGIWLPAPGQSGASNPGAVGRSR